MPNDAVAGALKALLFITLWFQQAPLQSDTAYAATCENQPCDCNGPFQTPVRSIELEQLLRSASAHEEWLSDRGSDPEHWTLEAQINQYDPVHNPPDGDEGKYPCDGKRNGPFLQGKMEFGEVVRTNALASRDLRGACFRKSDVRGVNLNNSNLRGANLYKADLSRAYLVGADLTGAILDCANLRGTDLTGATLTRTNFHRALFGGAFLNHAQLGSARFEPVELPPVRNLWEAQGLDQLRWAQNPSGLFALREELRRSGQDQQATRLTFAIEHQSTEQRLGNWSEHPLAALIGVLRLVLIEWTTGYGLYPFQAMGILISMIALFAIAYAIPLSSWSGGAIYRIFPEKSVQDAGLLDTRDVQRLHPDGLALVGYALWFSLLTAFHFGWRELNVGTWLSRLQTRDYILQPTGWVRFIAGVQSILSIYLVAIWALTYFGRPFG